MTARLFSDPPLRRALAGKAFRVDAIACRTAANILRNKLSDQIKNPKRRVLTAFELTFRIALTAISHKINWDFLSERLRHNLDTQSNIAELLRTITTAQVENWLSGYHSPDRVRAKERGAFLRNVGQVIVDEFDGNSLNILNLSQRDLRGPSGFLAQLDRFSAYNQDPLRKKSNVLVHDLVREGLVHFKDENEIQPAIDYHLMRLYLRTGRVVPIHADTHALLSEVSEPQPRLVRLLREAVAEALCLTALYAQFSVPLLNFVEWRIGRERCHENNPVCVGAASDNEHACANYEYCPARTDPNWMLKEPVSKKAFY